MADRRRYTGTKTLQVGWTLLVVGLVALVESVIPTLAPPLVTVGTGSLGWLVGLGVLGFRERHHWNHLVSASSFDRGPSGHTADLQQILHGRSVTVTTRVTGLLTSTHTKVRAPVEGVDASFTVHIVDDELADREGLTTGVEALDERFVVTGADGNVAAILSEQVAEALLAVDTPGRYTVMPDRVVYEVPFTHLTVEELEAAGEAVATIARQLEAVGRDKRDEAPSQT